jgi:hypothetical protein
LHTSTIWSAIPRPSATGSSRPDPTSAICSSTC